MIVMPCAAVAVSFDARAASVPVGLMMYPTMRKYLLVFALSTLVVGEPDPSSAVTWFSV